MFSLSSSSVFCFPFICKIRRQLQNSRLCWQILLSLFLCFVVWEVNLLLANWFKSLQHIYRSCINNMNPLNAASCYECSFAVTLICCNSRLKECKFMLMKAGWHIHAVGYIGWSCLRDVILFCLWNIPSFVCWYFGCLFSWKCQGRETANLTCWECQNTFTSVSLVCVAAFVLNDNFA